MSLQYISTYKIHASSVGNKLLPDSLTCFRLYLGRKLYTKTRLFFFFFLWQETYEKKERRKAIQISEYPWKQFNQYPITKELKEKSMYWLISANPGWGIKMWIFKCSHNNILLWNKAQQLRFLFPCYSFTKGFLLLNTFYKLILLN